jgi:drug/metabolite transporter (DMT)-like permease
MMDGMDFIYPLLSVVGESLGTTIDKLNYNKNKIKPGQLLFLLFSTMVTGLLVSLLFIHQPFPVVSLSTVGLIAFLLAISFGQNFFDYVGLSTKNLSLREPINNLEPILASFLAYVLFPSERNSKYIIAILIGVAILYVGNSDRKLKLELDRGVVYLFLGTICSAVIVSVYKLGLETITPVYLLLFRTVGVLLLTLLFFRPDIRGLKKNQIKFGVGSGLIYIVGNLSRLYSIQYLGVNFTILVLLLGPGLIYIGSALVLKEKVQLKQILTSAALLIIIISVIYL